MLPRRLHSLLARLSIGLLLFAQAAAIAQACVGPEALPSMAFAEGPAAECHDAAPTNPHANPNACLKNCTAGDQSTAQVPAAFAAMPATAVLTVPAQLESALVIARAEACELHSPDPPPSLRFCSFQL
jgi:hypothetical protein